MMDPAADTGPTLGGRPAATTEVCVSIREFAEDLTARALIGVTMFTGGFRGYVTQF